MKAFERGKFIYPDMCEGRNDPLYWQEGQLYSSPILGNPYIGYHGTMRKEGMMQWIILSKRATRP